MSIKNNDHIFKEDEKYIYDDEEYSITIFDNPDEDENNIYKKYSEEISQNIENLELDEEKIIYWLVVKVQLELNLKVKTYST